LKKYVTENEDVVVILGVNRVAVAQAEVQSTEMQKSGFLWDFFYFP